jgi:Transposase IS66 family
MARKSSGVTKESRWLMAMRCTRFWREPDPSSAWLIAGLMRRGSSREASEHYPQACSEVLSFIGELYAVEHEVPGPFPGNEQAQELRLRLRQERSKPILDSIWQWAVTQKGLPRSEFGKAIRYMLQRWEKLTLFVENPLVWLDNNHAYAARGISVGMPRPRLCRVSVPIDSVSTDLGKTFVVRAA